MCLQLTLSTIPDVLTPAHAVQSKDMTAVLAKDAFLVFRALCKLSTRSSESSAGADPTAIRGKVRCRTSQAKEVAFNEAHHDLPALEQHCVTVLHQASHLSTIVEQCDSHAI